MAIDKRSARRNYKNIDDRTVSNFGEEWTYFDQSELQRKELDTLFAQYFEIFPWEILPDQSVGFDLGCGSGRWASIVADRVGHLHCIDPSPEALAVAEKNLARSANCSLHLASVHDIPLEDDSMDFGYSLGVLHHVPDTQAGIDACVRKLKPGAPFLLYLYYAFDNRPGWYRTLWRVTDLFRRALSRTPAPFRIALSELIAVSIYLPLSRTAGFLESRGIRVDQFPLASYRHRSLYTMRTDSLDRFGTRLEQRFTAAQIKAMMTRAGLEGIAFSDRTFWCAIGFKSGSSLTEHRTIHDARG